VLYQALSHEDVWGSRGVVPRILNLGYRWMWVVSFTFLLIYRQGKILRNTLVRKLGGPQIRCGRCGEEKGISSLPLPGIKLRSFSPYPSHYIDWANLIFNNDWTASDGQYRIYIVIYIITCSDFQLFSLARSIKYVILPSTSVLHKQILLSPVLAHPSKQLIWIQPIFHCLGDCNLL